MAQCNTNARTVAGLEFVEKLLPTKLTSTDTTERNASMLLTRNRYEPAC